MPVWEVLTGLRQRKRIRSVGPRTLSGRTAKKEGEAERLAFPDDGRRRLPLTREGCADLPRPCPLVSCRYNLYLDVSSRGNVRLNFPDLEPDEMAISCALDVTEHGPLTLDQLAHVMNLTRERARQVQDVALVRMGDALRAIGITEAIEWHSGYGNAWDEIEL